MKALKAEAMASLLLSGDQYTIITHCRPDGDTVGSAAALCYGLRSCGKDASVLRNPELTERFSGFLAGMECEEPTGTVISVDVSCLAQLPVNYSGEVRICIDHHSGNDIPAEIACVDPNAAACGEIVFHILRAMGVEPDRNAASALYAAISTDTGCFAHNNTTPDTHRIAAELMECGIDAAGWNYRVFEMKSRARLLLEAHLGNTLRFYAGRRFAVCILTAADRDAMHVGEDDAASIANYPRNIEGVELGALIRELAPGKCKISLRSDPNLWDARSMCARLGGGGHTAASAATVYGSVEDALNALLCTVETGTGWDMTEEL